MSERMGAERRLLFGNATRPALSYGPQRGHLLFVLNPALT
jgi:hypothetical protein